MKEVINLLSVENISKSYGNKVLFEDLSFGLNQGNKVAIVAKNGAGKTTLFNLLLGKDSPDQGNITYRKDINVQFLSQSPKFEPNKTVLDLALESPHPQIQAIKAYEKAVLHPEDADHLQHCLNEMERLQAWDIEANVKSVLTSLALGDFEQLSHTLSGGQEKRLALAKILIESPDLLILDEPTNHLDLDMIEWLEDFLNQQNVSLLMVTHDRYFLDRICNVILELEDRKLYKYDGNYAYFLEKRAERHANEKTNVAKAKNLFKKELDWMRRQPQARGTKSKARIDAFYDLKKQTKGTQRDEEVNLDIQMERLGSKILELHKISKSFPNKTILNSFSYTFKKGDRIGIVGPNGVGKSTFFKLLLGEEKIDGGKIITGETVKFGYYGQKGIQVPEDKRVIEVVKDIAEVIPMGKGKSLSAAQLCERFLFEGEDQYNYVGKLSGGEKRRLYLLTVLMSNPNFLILDEPTNDLDILTLNVLEEFLQEFPGVVIIVSHDRFFLDKLAQHLFVFEGAGKIKDYNYSYSEFREIQKIQEKEKQKERQAQLKPTVKEAEKSRKKTKLSYKEKIEFEKLEKEIPHLEERKKEIESFFESGSTDADKLQEMSLEIEEIQRKLEEKETRWLILSEYADN